MREKNNINGIQVNWIDLLAFLIPLFLFWVILSFRISPSVSQYFHGYSVGLFLVVLIVYYLSFRLSGRFAVFVGLGVTMLLFALTLSYKWTSGFSDNQIMGGLVPYKDGKNYYLGANLILNGLPPLNANQSTERPLFPGFFASTLLLTGHNLKTALALIVQLVGVGIYLSSRQFYKTFGALAASLFAALLYFYIQPWIGYAMSEMFGFTLGCWGFSLIWSAAKKPKWQNLVLGILLLMVAVSARAGTFVIFPMLALWIGWIYRGEKRFSTKIALYAFGGMLLAYILINPVYSRVLGIPQGKSFGNFSYALYGQARGGTGWHSAVEEVGTRNPSVVYRATWNYFRKHPLSLFIGFAKSYRDFFFLGDIGIFPFGEFRLQNLAGIILWLVISFFMLWGIFRSLRNIRSNVLSLLISAFMGIFLSIPFLPPVDGGSRFYASTTPFFFALPAAGIVLISRKMRDDAIPLVDSDEEYGITAPTSIILVSMTVIVPLMMVAFVEKPDPVPSFCSEDQVPFVIEPQVDSYIDLYGKGSSQCGFAPDVCFEDFEQNNAEMATDDFYQEILRLSDNGNTDVRLIPAIDWLEKEFHYFYIPRNELPVNRFNEPLSGCATEITTTYQSIYKVESITFESK